jgi:hypothetical protein
MKSDRLGRSTQAQFGQGKRGKMRYTKLNYAAFAAVLLLVAGSGAFRVTHVKASANISSLSISDTAQEKVARAMAAGPDDIARSARIVDTDSQGHKIILREGSNGFTCMPGNPKVIGDPAMCADAASMQWAADFAAHKPKPTNTVPGITYMLAGATQRSDSDPFDTTSEPITVGPHWMIMWPFDPKATGLPNKHGDTGAYIMWAGSPYAHLHIMGRP